MSTLNDKEKGTLKNDPELITLAERNIALGEPRFAAIGRVKKWAESGRKEPLAAFGPQPTSAPADSSAAGAERAAATTAIAATSKPGLASRAAGAMASAVGLGSSSKPSPKGAPGSAAGGGEEESLASTSLGGGTDQPEEEEQGPPGSGARRTFTETESVFSGNTAGTGNPMATGLAASAPKTTVRDVREAASRATPVKPRIASWDDYANEIIDGLAYVGFDTAKIREQVRESFDFGELIHALGIYTRIGNGIKRRLKKGMLASDEAVEDAIRFLKDKDIRARVKGTDKLSLPRIAQAYAPVLRVLRRRTISKLDMRVNTSTPLELQDVAFGGYYPEADDFHTQFGRVLAKAAAITDKTAYDEKAVDDRNAGFRLLSKSGLARDSSLSRALSEVTDWGTAESWFRTEDAKQQY